MRTNQDLYVGSVSYYFIFIIITAGWLHLQPQFKPSISWFKNNESRLNHHLSGFLDLVH